MRMVIILDTVLISDFHLSEKWKNSPPATQSRTIAKARNRAILLPVALMMAEASFSIFLEIWAFVVVMLKGIRLGQELQGAFGEEGCAVFDAVLVEGDLWVVEEEGIVLFGFCAQEIELRRHFAGIEREVFADEIGEAFYDLVIAEQAFLYGVEFCMDRGIVEQTGIVGAEIEMDGAAG